MTNQTVREPHLNTIQNLVPLSTLDDTGVTGTAIDFGDTNNPNHIVIVSITDLTDIARVFVDIQESYEGGSIWTTICSFAPLTAADLRQKAVHRHKRYLRAVVRTEPPGSPVAPAFNVAILLLS